MVINVTLNLNLKQDKFDLGITTAKDRLIKSKYIILKF